MKYHLQQLLLGFCLLCPLLQAAPQEGFSTYSNKDECYRIDFPKNWVVEVVGDQDDIAAVAPAETAEDRTHANAEVWAEPLETPMPLETYFRLSLENLKRHSAEFKLVDQGDAKLDDIPAKWFRAVLKRGGVTGEILQYQMIVNDRIYILNFTAEPSAYSRFEKSFHTTVNSFRFLCK